MTVTTRVRIGFACEISKNGGTFAAPTWTAWKNVKDATLNLEADSAEASTRESLFKLWLQGQIDASIEFQSNWDTADTVFAAVLAAFLGRTTIDLAILDGANDDVGAQGLHADFAVLKCTRGEPLNGVVQADISLKPAKTVNAPEWITIAGG